MASIFGLTSYYQNAEHRLWRSMPATEISNKIRHVHREIAFKNTKTTREFGKNNSYIQLQKPPCSNDFKVEKIESTSMRKAITKRKIRTNCTARRRRVSRMSPHLGQGSGFRAVGYGFNPCRGFRK